MRTLELEFPSDTCPCSVELTDPVGAALLWIYELVSQDEPDSHSASGYGNPMLPPRCSLAGTVFTSFNLFLRQLSLYLGHLPGETCVRAGEGQCSCWRAAWQAEARKPPAGAQVSVA